MPIDRDFLHEYAKNPQVQSDTKCPRLLALYLPADEFSAGRQAGRARLEQYLDRAGKERGEQQWEAVTRAGLQAALAAWESYTLYYKEQDQKGWEAARAGIEAEYRLEAEERYITWVCGQFFEESGGLERNGLITALREAAESFEYRAGAGGGTRVVGAAEAGAAEAQWEAEVSAQTLEAYYRRWEASTGNGYGEIAGRLKAKGISVEGLGVCCASRIK
ncbi:MAG: hypothetical protein LBQ88_00555 [Treponema sp.]|jgi:hypothetical protein|nr:hypothetical protein [Treponema sp.]